LRTGAVGVDDQTQHQRFVDADECRTKRRDIKKKKKKKNCAIRDTTRVFVQLCIIEVFVSKMLKEGGIRNFARKKITHGS
jgi:hypothetical protein